MIQDTEKEIILNLLKNDNPYLYLGAGFSFGAKNEMGEEIPDGKKLKEIVLNVIKLTDKNIFEEEKNTELATVCQDLKDLDEKLYLKTIIDALSDFAPLNFHKYVADYKWNSIFTVNIDDIVEQVYDNDKLQIFVSKSNKENVKEKKQKLFKLHGCVRHPNEGIVFSRNEYLNAMTNVNDFRMLQLLTALNSNGFFVIGTEMKEDDLEYFKTIYEKSGDELMGHRIVFINPYPTSKFQRFIENHHNFSLIKCDTEEFFTFIHNNTLNLQKEYYSFKGIQRRNNLCSMELLREKIKRDGESTYKTKLYYGNAPTWDDFFEGFIIKYQHIAEVEKELLNNQGKRIYVIFGALYSGKTSFLMRLFFDISCHSDSLCLYNTSDEFTVSSIKEVIKSIPDNNSIKKIYLFYDDFGENYTEFQKAIDIDPRIILVTTSYELIHQRKKYALNNEFTVSIQLRNYLHEQDVIAIKDKFSEKGLEGDLLGKEISEWKKRISINENIVSALYNLTQGLDFQKRYIEIIKSDQNFLLEDNYKLIVIAAMCYKLGIPHIRPEMLSEERIVLSRKVVNDCCDYLTITESGAIKIKSLFIADAILANKDIKKDLIKYIINICISIAQNVQEKGMSYYKKVYEYLTKYKYLKMLNLSDVEISYLYEKLQKYYNDKSYYWLQVGLVEQSEFEFEYALTHFKSASVINPKSYGIIHAIARNYCKQAQYIDSKFQAKEFFLQGEKLFLDLIQNKDYESSKSYAIHSLISETIHFYKKNNMSFPNDKMISYKKLLFNAMQKDGQDEIMINLNDKFSKFINSTLENEPELYRVYEDNLDY